MLLTDAELISASVRLKEIGGMSDKDVELQLARVHLLLMRGDWATARSALSDIIQTHPECQEAIALQADLAQDETAPHEPRIGVDWGFILSFIGRLGLGAVVFLVGVAWAGDYIVGYIRTGHNGEMLDCPGLPCVNYSWYPVGLLIVWPALVIGIGIWIIYRALRQTD